MLTEKTGGRRPRVLLVAPSSPLPPEEGPEAIAAALAERGVEAVVGDSCRAPAAPSGYTVSPRVRAEDLLRGFTDPAIDGIWCVRGGEGAWQVLPYLDGPAIAAHPKSLIGFSDCTTLLLYLDRLGVPCLHGPTANRLLHADGFTWASLRAALAPGVFQNPPGQPIRVLRGGRAAGRLIGGNLSLAVHTLATPWQIDARNRVLFLEDVGEEVYALERMLVQMLRAGVLEAAAGLLFGPFTSCPNHAREAYGPEALLEELFGAWPRPVLLNVRSAHCMPMATLPMGGWCEIEGGTVRLNVGS